MNMTELQEKAKGLRETLNLETFPVGVKFVFDDRQRPPNSPTKLQGHRYCQALMKARRGQHVTLDKDGISCPAAAAAFGYKPLSDGLKNGKGLVGYGITREDGVGIEMFRGMPTIEAGELMDLYLFPLETAVIEPDIVVVEDKTESLMWIALAELNASGGRRIESSTAILQATCVDATIIPYKQQKMNLSYGCYGCREATDISTDETVLGFPFSHFEPIWEYVTHLARKALSTSRGKNAYRLLQKPSERT
jgi:uncharacterized protein (DUF169 family)